MRWVGQVGGARRAEEHAVCAECADAACALRCRRRRGRFRFRPRRPNIPCVLPLSLSPHSSPTLLRHRQILTSSPRRTNPTISQKRRAVPLGRREPRLARTSQTPLRQILHHLRRRLAQSRRSSPDAPGRRGRTAEAEADVLQVQGARYGQIGEPEFGGVGEGAGEWQRGGGGVEEWGGALGVREGSGTRLPCCSISNLGTCRRSRDAEQADRVPFCRRLPTDGAES